MNQKDRDKLQAIMDQLEQLEADERQKFDNLPEGLQNAESGQKIETAADYLSEALESLRQAQEGG